LTRPDFHRLDFFEKFHRLISDPPLPRFSQRDGFEIDYEFKLVRLHDWEVGCLFASENTFCVSASLPIDANEVCAIAREAASFSKLASVVNRRQFVVSRQPNNLFAQLPEQGIGVHQMRADPLFGECCESSIEFAFRCWLA
jgi:hypothetical protein